MKMLGIKIALTLLYLCCNESIATSLSDFESDSDEKIVGGVVTPDGDIPYIVAIYMNVSDEVKFHCGGSMISQYHVITAGHCVQGWYAERFSIRWSENQNQSNPSPVLEIRQVKRIQMYQYFHYEVGTSIPTNDIAILTLSEPLNVGVIPLPDQDEQPTAGTMCTVAGWGALEEGGESVSSLHSVSVEMQSFETCYAIHQRKMKEIMLCAGYPEGGKDACAGDSGGPLICNGTLYGIVSWGVGCAQANNYGVYTNVGLYREWVEKHNYVAGYPEGS